MPSRELSSASTGARDRDALAPPCASAPGPAGSRCRARPRSIPGRAGPAGRRRAARRTRPRWPGSPIRWPGTSWFGIGLDEGLAEVVVDERRQRVDLLRRAQQPRAEIAVEDDALELDAVGREQLAPRASTRARAWAPRMPARSRGRDRGRRRPRRATDSVWVASPTASMRPFSVASRTPTGVSARSASHAAERVAGERPAPRAPSTSSRSALRAAPGLRQHPRS